MPSYTCLLLGTLFLFTSISLYLAILLLLLPLLSSSSLLSSSLFSPPPSSPLPFLFSLFSSLFSLFSSPPFSLPLLLPPLPLSIALELVHKELAAHKEMVKELREQLLEKETDIKVALNHKNDVQTGQEHHCMWQSNVIVTYFKLIGTFKVLYC